MDCANNSVVRREIGNKLVKHRPLSSIVGGRNSRNVSQNSCHCSLDVDSHLARVPRVLCINHVEGWEQSWVKRGVLPVSLRLHFVFVEVLKANTTIQGPAKKQPSLP